MFQISSGTKDNRIQIHNRKSEYCYHLQTISSAQKLTKNKMKQPHEYDTE